MLFVSPANPDFSGQTPSAGKLHFTGTKYKTNMKKNFRTKLGNLFFVEHPNIQGTDMDVNTGMSTISSRRLANKHVIIIHKQKYRHAQ